MTLHATTFIVTVIFWLQLAISAVLMVISWRRLSAFFVSLVSLVIAAWAYYVLQAINLQEISSSRAFMTLASMVIFVAPPLFYHATCLMTKHARQDILLIGIAYLVNVAFINVLDLKNLYFGGSENFIIEFKLLHPNYVNLYRIVFFATAFATAYRAFQGFTESKDLAHAHAFYVMTAIPFFILGFAGIPGVGAATFNQSISPLALLGFPTALGIITFTFIYHRMVQIRRIFSIFFLYIVSMLGIVAATISMAQFIASSVGSVNSYQFDAILMTAEAMLVTLGFIIYKIYENIQKRLTENSLREAHVSVVGIATQIVSETNLDNSISIAMNHLKKELDVDQIAFLMYHASQESFTLKFCHGIMPVSLNHFDQGKSLIQYLLKKKQTVSLSKAEHEMSPSSFHQFTYALNETKIDIIHPLFCKDSMGGVILIGRKKNGETCNDLDLDLINMIGTVLASVIESSRLSDEATTDGLTGLYYQKHFKKRLAEEIEIGRKTPNAIAVLFFDIDFFKKLNDTFGHQAGDKVLEGVAKSLKDTVRASDCLARYGGEEFALFISENQSHTRKANMSYHLDLLNAAERLSEKMRARTESQRFVFQGKVMQTTLSIGIGFKDPDETRVSAQDLIHRADQALYHAKKNGRNRIAVATRSTIRDYNPPPSDEPFNWPQEEKR